MTTIATLCWILKDGKALLKLANSGISSGKWNAPGGKKLENESEIECIRREIFEETGLSIEAPAYHGFLNFFFGDKEKDRKEPHWIVHVFSAHNFSGELKVGGEGSLKWFNQSELPFENMWQDDLHWVPLLIEGKKFSGSFYFTKDGKELLGFNLKEVE